MFVRVICLVIWCLLGLTANTVKVQFLAPDNHPKQKIPFVLVFDLPEHSHIYGPDDVDSPTILKWKLPKGMEIEHLQWPPLQNLDLRGHTFKAYEGKVYVCGAISIDNGALTKIANQDIQAEISYIVCDKLCIPEKTVQTLKFIEPNVWNILPKPFKSLNFFTFNMLLMFAFSLIGGILLNLMPCVLPILSLKVITVTQHAHSKKLKSSALFFTSGTLLSFWMLAGLLLAFRAAGHQVGWGFQLQSPTVVTALIFVFYMFSLNLFGVFEIGTSFSKLGGKTSDLTSPIGSFFHGVLACIVATPCSAPFMGASVGFALTQGPLHGFVIFTGLALGLSAPYLLVCLHPKISKFLPKPGAWMDTFKTILGFGMAASVVWLMHVLAEQIAVSEFLNILVALLVISIASWIYGTFSTLNRTIFVRIFAALIALGLVIGAYIYATKPIENDHSENWQPYSASLVEKLRETSPVLIDFTAKWCITCQVNKRLVINTKKAHKLFESKHVQLVKADWTNYDPSITKALEQYGRSSVPLYILLFPDGTHKVLPELLSFSILKEALIHLD